ncbi:hypothetical protein CVT24_005001 [Panaeolus cyanescens]|uniref:Uncharacterized protein n=1 Tax=Panaeolus cyanescens TaxID=181874 RepID=A0A409VBV8_9AGAR|nr:hypothetical protein CVT24_005001 [Panaeolus cyanescens]
MSGSQSAPPGAEAPQISTLRNNYEAAFKPEEVPMLMDVDNDADLISLDSDDDFPSDIESTDLHEFTKDHDAPPYQELFPGEGSTVAGPSGNFEAKGPPSLESLDWESAQPVKTDGPLIQKTTVAGIGQSSKNPVQGDTRPMSPSQSPRASGVGSGSSMSMAGKAKSGSLCVICGKNPPYNDGTRAYNTCSKKCGATLQSMQGLPNQNGNSMGAAYDLRNGPKSMWETFYSKNVSNSYHQRATPTVKMCTVRATNASARYGAQKYSYRFAAPGHNALEEE